jgi:2-polyprenyl-3-methyl-5-hydroxy-6-metoxy-1,4-benzoquinol methylase
MDDFTTQNKMAWEYDAYNFWTTQNGTPIERAKQDLEDPRKMLKCFAKYFQNVKNLKIANICGSCGKKAVPLAVLGANVTVFDISEQNKKYACETAESAKVSIDYVVGDILDIDISVYGKYFDIVFMEGGVLHYFHEINKFMSVIYNITKLKGQLILSDFHPFDKIVNVIDNSNLGKEVDYFSNEIFEAEMAHAKFYDEEKRKLFPKCLIRRYTLSEIINSVLEIGFVLTGFDEYPSWTNKKLPGEFVILANRSR